MERVKSLASTYPVLIFSTTSCCMCHVMKRLFIELGANPSIHELDEDPNGKEMETALIKLLEGRTPPVPVVFINGQLVGTTEQVMTLHLRGSLIPMIKDATELSRD
ncbi:putative glutaredoxin-C14 [Aristolochia californica]|uniref:putative glutaredoxin-C14 n=1 Tax=Aristolochia californica TaxID=171875 RepID=UPI0035DCB718